MVNRVTAKVDRRNLKLTPTLDGSEAVATSDNAFKVTVINESERFASFQLRLAVPGIDSDELSEWYKIEPEFGTKKPPGASTLFDVAITRSPLPIYDQPIDLVLEVFSIEYRDLRTKQSLNLTVQEPSQPLRLVLPNSFIKGVPGDQIEIPVLLHNTSRSAIPVRQLRCRGIEAEWFSDRSSVQQITVEPNYPARTAFVLNIPLDLKFPLDPRSFTVEAITDIRGEFPSAKGTLEVFPPGIVEVECPAKQQQIPDRWFSLFRSPPAVYPINLKNTSNSSQQVRLSSARTETLNLQFPPPVPLNPAQKQSVAIVAPVKRHWFGWRKRHEFNVDAEVLELKSDNLNPIVRPVPAQQQLELDVLPIISPWLLIASGALLLALLWMYWLMNPKSPHFARVNSVRLDGNAGTVFSGSSDRQILRWQVNNAPFQVAARRLQFEERVNQNRAGFTPADSSSNLAQGPDRAVRVIRLKPTDNNVIAAGLENGTIQLWDVLGNVAQKTLFPDNDRVFDLDFTPDSRYLFSGHGSGQIRQWDLESSGEKPIRRILLSPTSFGIGSLGVYQPNPDTSRVVIAGQYNKLLLWDWANGAVYNVIPKPPADVPQSAQVPQPIQGQYHYIESVAIVRNLLATADNQGFITLWNLEQQQCNFLPTPPKPVANPPQVIQRTPSPDPKKDNSTKLAWGQCQVPIIDRWGDGHDGKAVRAIAIASDRDNRAYLVSAGDDGRVKLWFLDQQGRSGREKGQVKQKVLASLGESVHSVDIEVSRAAGYIFVTSDAPQNKVNLYREPLSDANQ